MRALSTTIGERIRQAIIDALTGAEHGLSTTELRIYLNNGSLDVVSEQVYRSLLILAHHGKVRRLPAAGNRAFWSLSTTQINSRVPARRVGGGFGNPRAEDSGHASTVQR